MYVYQVWESYTVIDFLATKKGGSKRRKERELSKLSELGMVSPYCPTRRLRKEIGSLFIVVGDHRIKVRIYVLMGSKFVAFVTVVVLGLQGAPRGFSPLRSPGTLSPMPARRRFM
ncbi:MAG: hypothetical protein EXR78_07975 [Deltaproteobacteria bacterium]|nr:hypothetical protein [Deltaproteobacteria bacterium]